MEPLYGMLYLVLSAMNAATWAPPAPELMRAGPVPAMAMTIPQPPTAYFRDLLLAKSQDRQQLLARHSPAQQTLLLSKIQRYEAMTHEQCDQQLRALELRWYLAYLMRQSPTNRAVLLLSVPDAQRELVESRLAFWDQLARDIQEAILKNEMAIRLQYSSPTFQQVVTNLPSAQRQTITADIDRWKALPVERQQNVYWSFQFLFELNEPPGPPGLPVGPDPTPLDNSGEPPMPAPLNQMLIEFKQLPSSNRVDCLENFQRFSQLPLNQRSRFIKAARRWNQMSETDRDAWRRAVNNEASPPPPLPPMPPGFLPSEPPAPPRIPRAEKKSAPGSGVR